MGTSNALALVMADIVVIALTIAVLMVLVLVVYLCIQIALRAARSLRPAARRPTRVTAELGPDGRDSGRTRIGS